MEWFKKNFKERNNITRINYIRHWFRKKRYPKLTGRVINVHEHSTWGDNVYFSGDQKITGWLSRLPKRGDEVRSEMESGKTGRFVITYVERCSDPSDMFFANVAFIDYL